MYHFFDVMISRIDAYRHIATLSEKSRLQKGIEYKKRHFLFVDLYDPVT